MTVGLAPAARAIRALSWPRASSERSRSRVPPAGIPGRARSSAVRLSRAAATGAVMRPLPACMSCTVEADTPAARPMAAYDPP
jgi:hypothetical protein